VKSWLRAVAVRSRSAAQAPTLARLDGMDSALNARLDTVIRRLDEIDALVQSFDGRVAAVAERSAAQAETQARLAKRVREIERLLAAPAPTGET
jgi:hypothetical protein